jgi:uncharacterized protein (TIGR02646 family)
MKHIVKGPEPEAFTGWKALANEDWKPTFENLSGEPKAAVTAALMREQGHICCYCERRLVENDAHIEHFKPQNDADVDALDFSNMLFSCQNKIKKGEPRHCGNLKGGWFDPVLLVSPFHPDCMSRFSYWGNGSIHPANPEDQGASTTIEKLGLGIPKLNALGEKAIEPFLDETLTDDEVQRFASAYLEPDAEGRFGEFWTTVQYLFLNHTAAA